MKLNDDLDRGLFADSKVYLNHPWIVVGGYIFVGVLVTFTQWWSY